MDVNYVMSSCSAEVVYDYFSNVASDKKIENGMVIKMKETKL